MIQVHSPTVAQLYSQYILTPLLKTGRKQRPVRDKLVCLLTHQIHHRLATPEYSIGIVDLKQLECRARLQTFNLRLAPIWIPLLACFPDCGAGGAGVAA